jgi:cobalt-zinc-cadmium efflux system outer membrane protein
MTAWRVPVLRAAIVAAAAVGCCLAQDSDHVPQPRPIAQDTPAFQAPEKPPQDPTVEEALPLEPAAPLALQDALALALMRNPELEMFSYDVRVSEARALQAGQWINPELDLRWYRLGIPRASADLDETRRRVILSQVFELGGKRGRRASLAKTESDLAGWDYEEKRIEVATNVAIRFVAVLGAQRRVESLGRFVAFLEQTRDRVETLVQTGTIRSLELHQANRQIGLARIDLLRAESELPIARYRLAATWGAKSPQFTEAVGELEQVTVIPTIESVIDLAQNSPSIARWDAEMARGQAALRLAKAQRVPDLRAGAGVRWQDSVSEQDYLVDIEIGLPLWDHKKGELREARHTMARAQSGRKAAEALTSEEIAEFYYVVVEAEGRAQTLRDEVLPAAGAAFEALNTSFETTARDLGDLLDARRDLARAEVRYIDALVEYHQALATLEGVVGHSLAGEPVTK